MVTRGLLPADHKRAYADPHTAWLREAKPLHAAALEPRECATLCMDECIVIGECCVVALLNLLPPPNRNRACWAARIGFIAPRAIPIDHYSAYQRRFLFGPVTANGSDAS